MTERPAGLDRLLEFVAANLPDEETLLRSRPSAHTATDRIRLDDLTGDQLDQLYDRLSFLEAFTDVVALELDDWDKTSPAHLRRELDALNTARAIPGA
ncbi:hypothetical protein [Streptomyces sp. NPDC002537]